MVRTTHRAANIIEHTSKIRRSIGPSIGGSDFSEELYYGRLACETKDPNSNYFSVQLLREHYRIGSAYRLYDSLRLSRPNNQPPDTRSLKQVVLELTASFLEREPIPQLG